MVSFVLIAMLVNLNFNWVQTRFLQNLKDFSDRKSVVVKISVIICRNIGKWYSGPETEKIFTLNTHFSRIFSSLIDSVSFFFSSTIFLPMLQTIV